MLCRGTTVRLCPGINTSLEPVLPVFQTSLPPSSNHQYSLRIQIIPIFTAAFFCQSYLQVILQTSHPLHLYPTTSHTKNLFTKISAMSIVVPYDILTDVYILTRAFISTNAHILSTLNNDIRPAFREQHQPREQKYCTAAIVLFSAKIFCHTLVALLAVYIAQRRHFSRRSVLRFAAAVWFLYGCFLVVSFVFLFRFGGWVKMFRDSGDDARADDALGCIVLLALDSCLMAVSASWLSTFCQNCSSVVEPWWSR